MPRIKRNHAEREIIQAWHALPEEMRRTSMHAALSAVRVKEKYALGTQGIEDRFRPRSKLLFITPCEPLADLDMRWRN